MKIQKHKNIDDLGSIELCRNTRQKEIYDLGVGSKYKNTKIQKYINVKIQKYKNIDDIGSIELCRNTQQKEIYDLGVG